MRQKFPTEVTLFNFQDSLTSLSSRRLGAAASIAALLIISATALRAEAPPAPPDAPVPQPQAFNATQPPASPIRGGATIYRIVEPGQQPPPMTVSQKFHGYVIGQMSFFPLLSSSVGAAISQADNSDPKWGQGWDAYGKRVGDAMIGAETSAFLREAVFPSLLHQDPRYYRKGTGSFAHRVFYAASRTVITRQDSGRPSFNYSAVGAWIAATGLTYAYYPDSNRSTVQPLGSFSTRLGGVALTDVLQEFSPDIKHKFFHHKN